MDIYIDLQVFRVSVFYNSMSVIGFLVVFDVRVCVCVCCFFRACEASERGWGCLGCEEAMLACCLLSGELWLSGLCSLSVCLSTEGVHTHSKKKKTVDGG